MNVEELATAATSAFRSGRLAEAKSLTERALSFSPRDPDLLFSAGLIEYRLGEPNTALTYFENAVQLDPTSNKTHLMLATILRNSGAIEKAIEHGLLAIRIDPQEPRSQNELGSCYLAQRRWQEAIDCFKSALQLGAKMPAVYNNLGIAYQGLDEETEAIRAFSLSLQLDPKQVAILIRMGTCLLNEGEFEQAAECGRKIVELDSVSAAGNMLLASALAESGRSSDVLKYAKRAVRLMPDDADMAGRYGNVLQTLGLVDQSNAEFRRSIEMNPTQARAYLGLARNNRFTSEDQALISQMRALTGSPDLSQRAQSSLAYALGKALEDTGEYESAMQQYDRANALVREVRFKGKPFDPQVIEDVCQFSLKTITEDFIAKNRQIGSPERLPLFVAGMMRSGSTLTEQILSCHPQIGAAGEQMYWERNFGKIWSPARDNLEPARASSVARQYRALLREVSPGTELVIDKLMTNFVYFGALHCLFPNARFIHVHRNPVDTCVSVWATPNNAHLDWANQKSGVVFIYRLFLQLAKHWKQTIPEDRYLEIRYEDLVSNPEVTIRQMLEFCEMPWDEACLRPQDNKRVVSTPSLLQVRQPIYRSSVERWRNFEPWLGEFAELLEFNG